MTTLSPTGGGPRRAGGGALPVITATVIALVIGLAVGWWFAGRGGDDTASPQASPTVSCPPKSTGTAKPIPLPAPKTITVNVYNATDRAGLARSTSTQLAARGFKAGKVANDPANSTVAASAEIRYGPKGAAQAKVVAAQVPGSVLAKDKRTDTTVDVVIGEKFTALATPAQAQAALAVTPSPVPGC